MDPGKLKPSVPRHLTLGKISLIDMSKGEMNTLNAQRFDLFKEE